MGKIGFKYIHASIDIGHQPPQKTSMKILIFPTRKKSELLNLNFLTQLFYYFNLSEYPGVKTVLQISGVLLSAVNSSDFDSGKSAFLLVLDAKSMTEIARAEFKDIHRFPKDFHGLFRSKTGGL